MRQSCEAILWKDKDCQQSVGGVGGGRFCYDKTRIRNKLAGGLQCDEVDGTRTMVERAQQNTKVACYSVTR